MVRKKPVRSVYNVGAVVRWSECTERTLLPRVVYNFDVPALRETFQVCYSDGGVAFVTYAAPKLNHTVFRNVNAVVPVQQPSPYTDVVAIPRSRFVRRLSTVRSSDVVPRVRVSAN